jgi:leucyl-tRNA synthetase
MEAYVSRGEYQPNSIEKKWQQYWLERETFKTVDCGNKPKYYVLDMFPYPSGDGLHVGHPEGYTATDIVSRYKRMNGFNVLHPMGWDAFGLPAEQHAVKTGQHPRLTTEKNINNFRRQIQSIGLSYDWSREISTADASYYKWTQWIFLQLVKKGLAYESYEPVNWCEELQTVLANEEVIDGKSEVGGFPVVKKPIRQWVLKITAYAERLLNDLEGLDWPEAIKEQQRNWIGKSQGADIEFSVEGSSEKITIFTTRPDTIFGATFFVLAPEHSAVAKITTQAQRKEIDSYVEQSRRKSDRDRLASTEKTGAFTGAYAINHFSQKKIPIYIADYVLASYGHGAIMAVPAHDTRDHAFAKLFNLPIVQVIKPDQAIPSVQDEAYEGDGVLINSQFIDGATKDQAIAKVCDFVESKGFGKKTVTYKLKDWLFSRQRYWGEPIPLMKDEEGNLVLVDESELPLTLPEIDDFKPSGSAESPLAKVEDWVHVTKNGKKLKRETNTMPQWAGSCWYYLRYIDPRNDRAAWDKSKEKYWMPVDLYVGGAEHAVMHLLYARFWHKVLFDLGYVSTNEPFKKLVNQGMILGENNEKMSKSRGNVINPDEVITQWGADSLRLYEMFMGPLEATKPWQTQGISGVHRFLKRFWRMLVTEDGELCQFVSSEPLAFRKALHGTIAKVTEHTEQMRFNTAISAMMELVNLAYKEPGITKESANTMILLLSPYAPHMSEELWEKMGHSNTLAYEAWPKFDKDLVATDEITLSIQVNGKFRGTLQVTKDVAKDDALAGAKAVESVAKMLEGKTIIKEIYVSGKTINFVVK